MRGAAAIILSALLLTLVHGQEQEPDTLFLESVELLDYQVKSGAQFREESLATDSLIIDAASLAEVLRSQTAIFVKSYGANGVASLSLRGTGASHTNLYWNNLDLGSPMLGMADLSLIPAQSVDEVDLQYGFASMTQGSGGLGGSLQLNSNYASVDSTLVRIGQELGSFGRQQTDLKLNLRGKKVRWQFGVLRTQSNNNFTYPNITKPGQPLETLGNASIIQTSAWQNLYVQLAENQTLALKILGATMKRQLPAPLLGDVNSVDSLFDASFAGVLEYNLDGDNSELLLSSGLTFSENRFTGSNDSLSNSNQYQSWQNNVRYRKSFLEKRLLTELGGRVSLLKARSLAYGNSQDQVRVSIFLDSDYKLFNDFHLNLLLRQEQWNEEPSPLMGAIGFSHHITEHQMWRMSVARNYRFPTLNDLYWTPGGNPELQPELSYSAEIGYEIQITQWQRLQAGVFHSIVDNWIQWSPQQNYWSPINLKKVANTGVEVSSRGSWVRGNWRIANHIDYAYTRSQTLANYNTDDELLHSQLPYVPFHKLSIGAELRYKGIGIRYVQQFHSIYYVNSANSVYMPAYNLADLIFTWTNVNKGKQHMLNFSLALRNLYNYPYQNLPFRPEPGFNWNLRLTYEFKR